MWTWWCFLLFPLVVCMCPINVALELGGNLRIFLVMNSENVVSYPALITFLRMVIVRANRDA